MSKNKLFYFGLENLKSRYTGQLSNEWFPQAMSKFNTDVDFIPISGENKEQGDIKVGVVLDAVGRGLYAMNQCQNFLKMIAAGEVKRGDIVYFADFITPGVDSIFFALDLYKITGVRFYARCWAGTVDEYDFTYTMRDWMRHYEKGLDAKLSGIFVGSTIHKQQLMDAGFKAPIHVLSLPVHKNLVREKYNKEIPNKAKRVIYTSRVDREKNPLFMLEVAKAFLDEHYDWIWIVTTSSEKLRSNQPYAVEKLYEYAKQNDRFIIKENLTKAQYYEQLSLASIQFNSALQDYVSFTAIEASIYKCDLVYPDFRSFPDCIPANRRYEPFKVQSAVSILNSAAEVQSEHPHIGEISNLGLYLEPYIMVYDVKDEINIWFENSLWLTFFKEHNLI
jgi:glycosyltransferase involved in cell wall biosynthesis